MLKTKGRYNSTMQFGSNGLNDLQASPPTTFFVFNDLHF